MYYCTICRQYHYTIDYDSEDDSEDDSRNEYFIYECMIDYYTPITKCVQTPQLCSDPLILLCNIHNYYFHYVAYDPQWNEYPITFTPESIKLFCKCHPLSAANYLKNYDVSDENDEYGIICMQSNPLSLPYLPAKYYTPKTWISYVEYCIARKYEISTAMRDTYAQCLIQIHFKYM